MCSSTFCDDDTTVNWRNSQLLHPPVFATLKPAWVTRARARKRVIMVHISQNGKIEEIIYAQLESGEDLLEALWEICREHDIRTGQILGGSGVLENFRFQRFPRNPQTSPMVVDIVTLEGPLETNVVGTIGTTIVDVDAAPLGNAPNGALPTEADVFTMFGSPYTPKGTRSPYVHAHMTATNRDVTALGHLMPGTIVADMGLGRKVPSHFTLVIAKVSGVGLINRLSNEGYYHEFGEL